MSGIKKMYQLIDPASSKEHSTRATGIRLKEKTTVGIWTRQAG